MKYEEVLGIIVNFFGAIHPSEADALRSGLKVECAVVVVEFFGKARFLEFLFVAENLVENWPACTQEQWLQLKLRDAIPACVLYEMNSDDELAARILLIRRSGFCSGQVMILPRKRIEALSLKPIGHTLLPPSRRGLGAILVRQRARLRMR